MTNAKSNTDKPATEKSKTEKDKPCKLDRNRSFGQVIGAPGVAYAQDGKNFDSNGLEVKD